MSFDYAKVAATSSKILGNFGQAVTIRRVTVGAYDPATGQSANTFVDTVVNGALFDFAAGQTLGPGGLIQQGDKKLLIDAGAVVPKLEDHVFASSMGKQVEYVIKGIGESAPAGVPVLYTLHLRT